MEYQLDIGGTMLSPQKIQSLSLSLMLRKNAELAIGELSIAWSRGDELDSRLVQVFERYIGMSFLVYKATSCGATWVLYFFCISCVSHNKLMNKDES